MPVRPPAIDDRSFDDLVDELLARIPAHTPEWTNPRQGDPGRTLIELFAWLTDTLLYRANLIPERQRLAFLRLLGQQMRPAIPARGLVSLTIDDEKLTTPITLQPFATVKGPVNFETLSEITVMPITAEAYYKSPLSDHQKADLAQVIEGLQSIYGVAQALPYQTTPIFADGAPEPGGFDIISRTVDQSLWLALLAPPIKDKNKAKEHRQKFRDALGKHPSGARRLLSVGVAPMIEGPESFDEIRPRVTAPHVWEIASAKEDDPDNRIDYLTLDVIADTTSGLTRNGVISLALPAAEFIGAPSNDVRKSRKAGVGDYPPRIDSPEKAERLLTWIRLRPVERLERLSLSWMGINAVEVDQRQTIDGRVIGQSDGSGDQVAPLPGQSVDPLTLEVQIEEIGRGYQTWRQIDDLALAGRDDGVYQLDAEAGSIQFGDGLRGRIPEIGARIRVSLARAGGGRAGNLAPGALTEIANARDEKRQQINAKLKVAQNLATSGGEDAETLAEAERRIPALFRHRNRAVTADDYRRIAADTPGIRMGRVELMERFKPQQRQFDIPGVVSVMALPYKSPAGPPNPRADRPFLESVHSFLDERRPLATELYVIGCEYIPLGVSVGFTIRDGYGREDLTRAVRDALFDFLWPLAPGGIDSTGWPLGRSVMEREIEVVIARTPGVRTVNGVNLFERVGTDWSKLSPKEACAPVELTLAPWQLPELLSVVVLVDAEAPPDLRGAPNPFGSQGAIPVPVVPEVC